MQNYFLTMANTGNKRCRKNNLNLNVNHAAFYKMTQLHRIRSIIMISFYFLKELLGMKVLTYKENAH